MRLPDGKNQKMLVNAYLLLAGVTGWPLSKFTSKFKPLLRLKIGIKNSLFKPLKIFLNSMEGVMSYEHGAIG